MGGRIPSGGYPMDSKSTRKDRLEELKRLRKEGGTHFDTVKLEKYDDGDEVMEDAPLPGDSSDYGDAEDLRDFVEDAEPRGKLPSKRDALPIVQQHRQLANFFKKKGGAGSNASSGNNQKPTGDDSYFKSLMQQYDDEGSSSSSSSEDEEEKTSPAEQASMKMEDVIPTSAADLPGQVPPSEMFAPFDPAVLNADVVKQLEEEDWDAIDAALGSGNVYRDDESPKEGMGDFMKENLEPTETPASNAIPMEIDSGLTVTMPHANSLDYEAPKEGEIDFYWIDAFEKTATGTVYLFGKVQQPDGAFVSCCVTVQNIQRNVYFLPREFVLGHDGRETEEEEVTLSAVQQEISALLGKHRISQFTSRVVSRKYAFDVPDIPVEADWIKVAYGFGGAQLPLGLTGRTFSHVFGSNTSALELLLMKRKMMGPCWLRVAPSSTSRTGASWCKMDLTVDNPKRRIRVLQNGPEPPPLTVMSLSLRTMLNEQSQHEIISASALVFNGVSTDSAAGTKCSAMFTVVRDPDGVGFTAKFTEQLCKGSATKIEIAKNERMLLSYLVTMIHRHDPDVLVGHNFLGFDLGVLLHRMKANKVEQWSRLGRLNWSAWPKANTRGSTEASWAEKQIVSGRLVCDSWLSARDLVKAKSYTLDALAQQVLSDLAPPSTDSEELFRVFGADPSKLRIFFQTADSCLKLLRKAERDAYHQAMLIFRLMVLPLSKQLTNIAGNLWSRTLTGARAERNEFLLLHEFHTAKFICPDKSGKATPYQIPAVDDEEEEGADHPADERRAGTTGRRKPAYAGGLVLEPKRGFYDKIVLLLDFNSLYPSIIQEYNICFTTVARDPSNTDEIPEVPGPEEAQGILPRVLKGLVERRAAVKRLMKDPKTPPTQLAQYNIRQQALKLTANSMYGCLGFSHSRFYAKPLAMLITSRGRDILQSTVTLAQQSCHLDVVYGDTDSIMINTGSTDLATAKKLAQQVKRVVNERYRLLEIELDGIFEKLLLLRKKKYAALVVEEGPGGQLSRKLETKGLDMVRRDWSAVSVEASDYCLQRMMGDSASAEEVVSAIHEYLEALAIKVREGQLPLPKYVISKNLTKDPEAYADAKGQPHVSVALRMKTRGLSAHSGDTIPYVICINSEQDVGSSALADRAFHPDEVQANPALSIDFNWYLAQQIHPPVARLCECMEGTDSARLAAALGLDAKKYGGPSPSNGAASQGDHRLLSFMSDEEKFKDVAKLSLTCTGCQTPFPFVSAILPDGKLGMQCPACSVILAPQTVYCQVLGLIRTRLSLYHQYWLQCDEPSCQAVTRRMRVYESRCVVDTCRGSMHPRLPGSAVYHQLLYLRSLFDWDKLRQAIPADDEQSLRLLKRVSAEYEPVRMMVLHQLNQCSFPIINLRDVFSFMLPARK